ncbi:MAG: chemotaxis protein [Thiobacillus sp.]|nr:chemotaxis protein [Thiobacillus sp.]
MNAQVMHLLSGVSTHGDLHLAEVERDLVQMDGLLEEAIKKLCSSFMAIHEAVDKQQRALDSMLIDQSPSQEHAARLETIQGEINRHVGAAITGLQFQDMTSQLIGRMVKHLAGLRDVFGELEASEPVSADSPYEDLVEKLNQISNRVCARCAEQTEKIRSSVSQRHMESGDIDLF